MVFDEVAASAWEVIPVSFYVAAAKLIIEP
jgi:hypothetical protein